MTDTSFGRSEYKIVPFPQSMLCEGHALSTDDKLRGEPPAAMVEGTIIRMLLSGQKMRTGDTSYMDTELANIVEPDGPWEIRAAPLQWVATWLLNGLGYNVKPLGYYDDITGTYANDGQPPEVWNTRNNNWDSVYGFDGARTDNLLSGTTPRTADPITDWGVADRLNPNPGSAEGATLIETRRLQGYSAPSNRGPFNSNEPFAITDIRSLAGILATYCQPWAQIGIGFYQSEDLSLVNDGANLIVVDDDQLYSENNLVYRETVGADFVQASDPTTHNTGCFGVSMTTPVPLANWDSSWPTNGVQAIYVRRCDIVDHIQIGSLNGPVVATKNSAQNTSDGLLEDYENSAKLFMKLSAHVEILVHDPANETRLRNFTENNSPVYPQDDISRCTHLAEYSHWIGALDLDGHAYYKVPDDFQLNIITGDGEYWVEVSMSGLSLTPSTWAGSTKLRQMAESLVRDELGKHGGSDEGLVWKDKSNNRISYPWPSGGNGPVPAEGRADTVTSAQVRINDVVLLYPKIKPYATSG